MVWKLSIVVLCLTAIVHINAIALIAKEPDYGPAEYEFHYEVNDPHTGDIKSQKEQRKGDAVVGSYELIDSDGYKRLVQYKADDHSGFEAIVTREPTSIKIPIPEQGHKLLATKILQPIAPLVHYAHAPAPLPLLRLEKPQAKLLGSAPRYDNHVLFSGPSHNYKY